MPYWVHIFSHWQEYGGPEEGGWYYDAGTPVPAWEPVKFQSEADASLFARGKNESEHRRADTEEDYEYTSVLARSNSTHYTFKVLETSFADPYPKVRPHYE